MVCMQYGFHDSFKKDCYHWLTTISVCYEDVLKLVSAYSLEIMAAISLTVDRFWVRLSSPIVSSNLIWWLSRMRVSSLLVWFQACRSSSSFRASCACLSMRTKVFFLSLVQCSMFWMLCSVWIYCIVWNSLYRTHSNCQTPTAWSLTLSRDGVIKMNLFN